MGQDKAFLRLDGVPLIEHVVRRVRPVADDMLVVIGNRAGGEFSRLGIRTVPDVYPGRGTLGGIYTAITAARFDYTLVVGCDMPLLSTQLLTHLAGRPRDYEALVPSIYVPGDDVDRFIAMPQPLHTIYGKTCLPVIKRHLEAGQLRVMELFDELRVEHVDEIELRSFDRDLHSFLNANTPAELERVRSLLTARSEDDCLE